jgi:anti-anti-sigma factor
MLSHYGKRNAYIWELRLTFPRPFDKKLIGKAKAMMINRRDKNNVVIFDIEGEIKRSDITDVTLHQLVKEQLEVGKKHILLNFEKVEFIDSFGVGEILASYISTHNLGGKLKLARISKKLFLIFQVTMLTKVLDIHEEEDSALQSFFKD